MGVVVSSSAAPSSSGGGLLTLFLVSSVGSLSWRQLSTNFPNVSPSKGWSSSHTAPVWSPFHGVQSLRHRLLQRGSPMVSQALPANLLQHGLLSLHGSTGPAMSLLQHGLPMGSQPTSGIHLLQRGVHSTGCRWISAPLWTSMGWRGTACITMVFSMGCRGKVSALASWAPPLPPSSLTLVSAELFLSHSLTPLSRQPFHHSFFSPS